MIITFAHYKGGTGKTTSCLSIAGWLAKFGEKVLVVDFDPQGNATSGLGIDKKTLIESIYDIMRNKRKKISSIILETGIKNLHLVPADQNLDRINLKTYQKRSDALYLKNALKDIKKYYDYILIDTPPVHSHFIINGMAAADSIIVVLDPGIFALEGIEILKDSFGDFFKKLNLNLNIDMALITKSPGFSLFRKNHAKEIRKDTKRILEKEVFIIPYSNHIYHTHIKGKPISHYKPRSKVGRAYKKVALNLSNKKNIKKEINKRVGVLSKK